MKTWIVTSILITRRARSKRANTAALTKINERCGTFARQACRGQQPFPAARARLKAAARFQPI
ncbi:hypothetical protein KDX32_31505 [Burkholderia ambifaria]|jgi:hypothetical protein|uniref:hypothetical protein n=1 Tax=Burkholderia TaxID=32008 RepID=UPI00110EBA2A|nr:MULTISPECIES: hypothetical protein [Burkholderia]MBR8067586.1 hypothetical protein [Burkholderia ambifaria]QDW54808.1 hypothetical protein FFI87_031650 [Burkholderia sp. KBS0801]